MPFIMPTFKCLTYENRSQVRKDECLDESNHYFDQINKYRKQNRQRREPPACYGIHRSENKNQCNKLKMMMCPATMFAKRRTINAKGLVKTPSNSTGNMMRKRTIIGTPGYQKICPQKCLLVLKMITKKEITPNTTVNAMFPVTLADPGINPNKLLMRMKKKTVSK